MVLLCLQDDGVRYRLVHWLNAEATIRIVDLCTEKSREDATAIICDARSASHWVEGTRFMSPIPTIHALVNRLEDHPTELRGVMNWDGERAKELATALARRWRVFAHDDSARAWEALRVAEQLRLTPRQSEILLLASMELTPEEAGARLDISGMTVKEHFKAIRRKTKVSVGVICRRIRDNALQLQSSSRRPPDR